jgi:hypothetical protein
MTGLGAVGGGVGLIAPRAFTLAVETPPSLPAGAGVIRAAEKSFLSVFNMGFVSLLGGSGLAFISSCTIFSFSSMTL